MMSWNFKLKRFEVLVQERKIRLAVCGVRREWATMLSGCLSK